MIKKAKRFENMSREAEANSKAFMVGIIL